MAGKFMHGALLEYGTTANVEQPNVIVFQFNPETMTHSWTQPEPEKVKDAKSAGNPLAAKGIPGESFSFTIAMDANETLADGKPESQNLAGESGIYSRLAALEMLLFPVDVKKGTKLMGTALIPKPSEDKKQKIPAMQVPTVLFSWGKNRILPVRVTNLSISETLYDTNLNPIHAKAQLSLRVLTPEELQFIPGPIKDTVISAYTTTQKFRQDQANANPATPTPYAISPTRIVRGG